MRSTQLTMTEITNAHPSVIDCTGSYLAFVCTELERCGFYAAELDRTAHRQDHSAHGACDASTPTGSGFNGGTMSAPTPPPAMLRVGNSAAVSRKSGCSCKPPKNLSVVPTCRLGAVKTQHEPPR